ncbi:FRAS1-related extracellular matrix protein 1b [Nerophis lumbriciformis]|uniref:FRAS1-related extracellular matrix protein 1b n=1 Tax=Nerophis lumbriciformis TaxID=546530 RepID=UPI002ADF7574|nr:FRAS1-related extracellular matrix protein 1b [Nerophis lumbriciformis]
MAAVSALFLLAAALAVGGETLVVVNVGMEVARGRSAFLTKEQLAISAEADAHCKVEVVLNEPVMQRVGRLTPQVFDCDFLPHQIKYQHHGSPLLDHDSVLLRVYRFSSSETLVETVVLAVRVVDSGSSLADLGSTGLVVPDFYALSNSIDRSVLNIKTRDDAVCTVRLVTSGAGVLAMGQLVREDDASQRKGRDVAALCPGNKACKGGTKEVRSLKTSCQDFLTSGLKYQHLSPPSPDVDYVAISVELREQATRALLEMETLWLPVLIRGAMPNQLPQASFMASFILEVDQFILTPFTTAALDAEDHETPKDQLVFNVTVPPPEGYIAHLDDHTKPIGSFTWLDLHDMKVAYQPPNSSRVQRNNMEVEFRALDGSYASSPAIVVHVSIRVAETNAPRVSWNTGLDLLEGQARPITWEQLQIVDNDNIHAVFLVAVDGPLHGRLSVRGGKAFMFRVQDLREGVVVYHHSDSDTTRDHIVFRISDGRHSIRHKFPINILPKDDSPPFLVNNVALEVQEGGAVRLQETTLLASDLDSSDDYILYQITAPPQAGQLVRKTSPQEPGIPVDRFLQRNVLLGQIYYQHSGEEHFEDSFDFILSDIQEPPNLSHAYTTVVSVFPVEDQLPVEVWGSSRRLTVKETEVVYITRSHLHFSHAEHPDTDLTYVITRPCFSPLHPGLMDAGRLFYTDSGTPMRRDPTAPVLMSFTQHAVDHMKVAFMPPVEDIGPQSLFVQFTFSVSDHHGGTVSGLHFNITIIPVDDQAPEAFTNLLRVEEGGGAFLTEEHLLIRDRDSLEEALRVELRGEARHGHLELRGGTLRQGEWFMLSDLRRLTVRYIHDDSETTEDDIALRVTDGVNSAEVVMLIQVLPVNDEPPQLGGGLRGELSCQEGGRVQVTADYLSATDRDSEDARLTYMLARRPARGELQRAGQPADKFSQEDLLQGHVYYVHTGGEIGPRAVSDTVTLIISDGGLEGCCRGDAPPVPLHGSLPVYDLNITLLPVNNKVPAVILADSMLVVDEGSFACLNKGVLGATDPDSLPEQLTFHLDTKPLHGFLENTLPTPGSEKSNAGIPVASFSLDHLTYGFINYVQSEHKGAEPTVDQLLISVSDGLHHSASIPLYIIINPTNDEAPSLKLANFTVKEGGVRELTPSILDAFDLDAPPDVLTFTVATPPAHGSLMNGVYGVETARYKEATASLVVASFTLRQLREGMKLVYMHDDTETLKDVLTLRLTDGVHAVQGTSWVTVLPLNDHKPLLLKNAGLEVESGGRRVISSVVLEAQDADSPPDRIFYFLNAATRFGELQLKVQSGWTQLAVGQNFTQDDVDMNRLWYAHAAAANASGFKGHDSFRFSLSDLDNSGPPQSFFISVHTVHKGNISLASRAVPLAEGQRVVLNTDFLLASDGAGRPDELIYTVTVPPRHGLVHGVRRPGVPLHTFTQLDVAAHRVCYTHDNGHAHRSDSFSFVITNGHSSRTGSLHLHIQLGDRIPPTLERNAGLGLQDGATETITADHLQLSDPDTAASNLSFVVTEPPRYGRLMLRGVPLTPPLRFTQTDVDQRHLAYWHSRGSRAEMDRFYFLPTDGNNPGYLEFGQLTEEPAAFIIQVEQVDRSPPSLTTRGSPSEVAELSDGRFVIFITSRHLQAADSDSPVDELQFSVIRPPHFGYLENILTGAYIKGRFTQRDVEHRSVVFVLPPDMEVTADSFQFRLSDPAGNSALPETLELSWSRVQLSATCYRTCETAGTLQVQIERSGKSSEPAYVAIQVEDGTAKLGQDFTHSTAGLIQFDPGVNIKTWNIYLKDDRLEENHETFTVTLKNPKNSVLGQRNSASVEIIDPRGGKCDPGDLSKEEEDKATLHPTIDAPPPPTEDEPVTDIEVELLWENQPHPPRGDVPNRHHYPEDQAVPGNIPSVGRQPTVTGNAGNTGLKVRLSAGPGPEQKVWTFHSLTPLRLEEVAPGGAVQGSSHHTHVRQQGRLENIPQLDHAGTRQKAELRQRKAGRSLRSWCEDGWTHHKGRCYLASLSVSSWASAEHTCSLLFNSSLASVRSRRDMPWLWKFGGKKPFWISLPGGMSEGKWTSPPTANKPDIVSECVLVQQASRWTSTHCSAETQHAFICSSPANTH